MKKFILVLLFMFGMTISVEAHGRNNTVFFLPIPIATAPVQIVGFTPTNATLQLNQGIQLNQGFNQGFNQGYNGIQLNQGFNQGFQLNQGFTQGIFPFGVGIEFGHRRLHR